MVGIHNVLLHRGPLIEAERAEGAGEVKEERAGLCDRSEAKGADRRKGPES